LAGLVLVAVTLIVADRAMDAGRPQAGVGVRDGTLHLMTTRMSVMTHKGYAARVECDPQDEIFVGRVLWNGDRVTFHDATVTVLCREIRAAGDYYLADGKAALAAK